MWDLAVVRDVHGLEGRTFQPKIISSTAAFRIRAVVEWVRAPLSVSGDGAGADVFGYSRAKSDTSAPHQEHAETVSGRFYGHSVSRGQEIWSGNEAVPGRQRTLSKVRAAQ